MAKGSSGWATKSTKSAEEGSRMEYWTKKSLAITDALGEMGISLWDDEYDFEEKDGDVAPYLRYIYFPLLVYTGIVRFENLEGPSENTHPVGDAFLINAITKHFLSKNDEFLAKVAWNTFFPTISYENSELRAFLEQKKWVLKGNRYESFFYNRTAAIETNRLVVSPFTEGNIGLSENWSCVKEYREKEGPIYVPQSPFSPSYGHGRISFEIVIKGKEEAIGAIMLDRAATDGYPGEHEYEAKVFVREAFRGQGYEAEALKAVLLAIKEKKIKVYSERDYKCVYEEYYPSIGIVRSYAKNKEEESIFLDAGMADVGTDYECLKESDSSFYKKKRIYAFLPFEE